jgi:hypothetical protein
MTCKVKANPKPTIVWYQAGKVVKESSKVSMSVDQKDDIYSIKLELKVGLFSESGLRIYHLNMFCHYFQKTLSSISVDIYHIFFYEI